MSLTNVNEHDILNDEIFDYWIGNDENNFKTVEVNKEKEDLKFNVKGFTTPDR